MSANLSTPYLNCLTEDAEICEMSAVVLTAPQAVTSQLPFKAPLNYLIVFLVLGQPNPSFQEAWYV
jgi:hypothetical protein